MTKKCDDEWRHNKAQAKRGNQYDYDENDCIVDSIPGRKDWPTVEKEI